LCIFRVLLNLQSKNSDVSGGVVNFQLTAQGTAQQLFPINMYNTSFTFINVDFAFSFSYFEHYVTCCTVTFFFSDQTEADNSSSSKKLVTRPNSDTETSNAR